MVFVVARRGRDETPDAHGAPGTAVGVDRGVVVAVATSDGELADREFVTAGEQRRAVVLARKLSRAAKGSANRAKIAEGAAKLRAASVTAARTSAPRPLTGWRAPTRWWCSKTSKPAT